MKIIESSIILPFTLFVMVLIIFLSFNLHDMVLCKSATYKFLICDNTNSVQFNENNTLTLNDLNNYIYRYSLSNNIYSIRRTDESISISSDSYNTTIEYSYFNNCDLLRKCSVASDIIDTLK